MAGESLRDLLEFAVDLAEKAGEITLRYFQGRFAVETKADASPVTVADREAETYIRQAIESRFPSDGIVGEEFGEARPEAGQRWIIDPIDGTYSFVRGVPLFGVLIALERRDEPVVGVIRLPALDETVAAARGEGCHWRGQRARVSDTSELGAALCLATELRPEDDPARAAALERLVTAVGTARTWGDCYGYTLVATGRADVMVDPAMRIWDCAALLPVIEEAGGRFTDWRGERTIRGADAVASN
ncbi:MAG: histidinol-phosphatase, partial [Chloroflexi bacterium]|nr:histidinol-phosphatase [Chloroflexota bacterium]